MSAAFTIPASTIAAEYQLVLMPLEEVLRKFRTAGKRVSAGSGRQVSVEIRKAGEQAVVGARALSKNAYKIPLTKNMVKRTLVELSQRA